MAGCQTHPPPARLELVHRSQPRLGTFVTVSAYGADRPATLAAISAAFDEFRRADELMSIHRSDSELSRLNARAASGPVPVSAQLFQVIATAQDVAAETEGAFDVTIGPLADLWGFIKKDAYRLPAQTELRAVLPQVNYQLIELNRREQTVQFADPGISIDLGGIGKGYAVDRAIERLLQLGITNALVKAGGDLRAAGAPPGRSHWTVQLEDPRKQARRVSVALRDAALSTSGDYENFFEIGGRRYSHLLDPRTGLPVAGLAACTVIAPSCVESDAWATACFVMGVERSLTRFGERLAIRFHSFPEATSPSDGLIRQSPSFPETSPAP